MPTLSKAAARTQLFSLFLDNLKKKSALHEPYGDSIEDAYGSLSYATAVRYEMLNAENDERYKQQIPSAHTLLRWLQRGNFSGQVQSRSVLSVARYLGFENFHDFQQSVEAQHEVTRTDEPQAIKHVVPDNTPTITPAKQKPAKRVALWGILGLAAIMLLTYGASITFTAPSDTATVDLNEVKALIERVNKYEFELYAQVGRQPLDTSTKHQLFTERSPAWKTINKVVLGSIDLKYVLNLNRSHRSLIFAKVEAATDSTILVHTREAWTIIWESDISVNTRYDEINDQYYTLNKEDDRWKVHLNAYTGVWTPDE